jgi:hypothetical protein
VTLPSDSGAVLTCDGTPQRTRGSRGLTCLQGIREHHGARASRGPAENRRQKTRPVKMRGGAGSKPQAQRTRWQARCTRGSHTFRLVQTGPCLWRSPPPEPPRPACPSISTVCAHDWCIQAHPLQAHMAHGSHHRGPKVLHWDPHGVVDGAVSAVRCKHKRPTRQSYGERACTCMDLLQAEGGAWVPHLPD